MAMSPTNADGSIVYTPEYNSFISKLVAFHAERGTHLDAEPRVGIKHIDLLQLFNIVVSRGGYDKVSDEKLAWRKLGQELQLGMSNLPAQAFTLKTTYYKFLAAYEIKSVHGKEPPPKEILEDTTAKGGNLLTRTLENFKGHRRDGMLNNDNEDSAEDGTPARDRMGSEEAPGSGGRATRGLRQAPPPRVLFQPDTMPARARHAPPASVSTPQPRGASTYNPPSNPEHTSQIITGYEPRPQMPLTLRPVLTPGNNPVEFLRRQKALKEQALAAAGHKPVVAPRIMLPGTGFDGPNIYLRCLMALKSGIPSEQDYALHHLVKISMERGDKYRFESFAGLAEALIEKALEVSNLFYDVSWEVSYLDDGRIKTRHTLDGVEGSPDILERIDSLKKKDIDDNIQTAEFSDKLLQINEAALTLRNMVMLEENAHYVSRMYPLRDFISIALHLPNLHSVVELKHYALDIAEQLTKYLVLSDEDPMYLSLVSQLESDDRGAILTSLRAISRISMNLEEQNRLKGIPTWILQKILNWLLLDDEELVTTCLDFLYQFTAIIPNVDVLLSELPLPSLISHLVRLLSFGAVPIQKEFNARLPPRSPAPTEVPDLPADLLKVLLTYDEPERSSHWLRSLFEEDKDESITQIALWQAYQSRFAGAIQETGRPLLPAADFIKNVSTTFADKAAAQVQPGPVQKFIIKGLRIRKVPVDIRGREYLQCQWISTQPDISNVFSNGSHGPKECGSYFMGAENMYNHIISAHTNAKTSSDGKFVNGSGDFVCSWKNCTRYTASNPASMKLSSFGSHLKIHLPKSNTASNAADSAADINGSGSAGSSIASRNLRTQMEPSKLKHWQWIQGQVDERGDASGIPLSAVLVLRNLARNLPKTEGAEQLRDEWEKTFGREGQSNGSSRESSIGELPHFEEFVGIRERLFKPVEREIWEVFAGNKSLSIYLADLLPMISESER